MRFKQLQFWQNFCCCISVAHQRISHCAILHINNNLRITLHALYTYCISVFATCSRNYRVASYWLSKSLLFCLVRRNWSSKQDKQFHWSLHYRKYPAVSVNCMCTADTARVLCQYYGSIMFRDGSHLQRVSGNRLRVILAICGSSQVKSVFGTALWSDTTSQNTPLNKVNIDRDKFTFQWQLQLPRF
jgi:hypothetical protein